MLLYKPIPHLPSNQKRSTTLFAQQYVSVVNPHRLSAVARCDANPKLPDAEGPTTREPSVIETRKTDIRRQFSKNDDQKQKQIV